MNTPKNIISLPEAEAWTAEWRKQNPGKVKAFLIPTEDLQEVLNERPDKVRAYLGIEINPNDGSQTDKLVLVGTRLDGSIYKDMLPPLQGSNGNYIYDFTLPCPIECDPTSPLNSSQK